MIENIIYKVILVLSIFLCVSFALSNTDYVTIGLWPLPSVVSLPLYAPIFLMLVSGFFLGMAYTKIYGFWKSIQQKRLKNKEKQI